MPEQSTTEDLRRSIRYLKIFAHSYDSTLSKVYRRAAEAIPLLVESMNDKDAAPVVKALVPLMDRPEAVEAVPRLLDLVVLQSPLYPDVVAALVRAGERAVPALLERLEEVIRKDDDEAVRNLLDVGLQLPEDTIPHLPGRITDLLESPNPHLREVGADACWRLGRSRGLPALAALRRLASEDPEEPVREAAREAIDRIESAA